MTFHQVTSPYRFLFLLLFSVAVMMVDHRSQMLVPVRAVATVINLPFQFLIGLPSAIQAWSDAHYPDDELHTRYVAVKSAYAALAVEYQKYEKLQHENARLRELMDISEEMEMHSELAQIVDIGLGGFADRLALNRGAEANLYIGQPVIAIDGVIGQVSRIGNRRSVVTMITDPAHALPVQVQRNGLRTIVRGLGVKTRVEVPFLPAQADIRVGDVLVTSGLGGGFPEGYKVARVKEVLVDANRPFIHVDAEPFADIDRTREALLLWSGLPEEVEVGASDSNSDSDNADEQPQTAAVKNDTPSSSAQSLSGE